MCDLGGQGHLGVFQNGIHLAERKHLAPYLKAYYEYGIKNPNHYRLMFPKDFQMHTEFPNLVAEIKETFNTEVLLFEILKRRNEIKCVDCYVAAVSAWIKVHGFVSLAIEGRLNT